MGQDRKEGIEERVRLTMFPYVVSTQRTWLHLSLSVQTLLTNIEAAHFVISLISKTAYCVHMIEVIIYFTRCFCTAGF